MKKLLDTELKWLNKQKALTSQPFRQNALALQVTLIQQVLFILRQEQKLTSLEQMQL